MVDAGIASTLSGAIGGNSGRGGLYATWFNHGIYLNGAIYGGHNTYDSSRAGLGGLATGGTEGAEWSTFISGGYDFHFGPLTVGPIFSAIGAPAPTKDQNPAVIYTRYWVKNSSGIATAGKNRWTVATFAQT